ncbi:hypothetical protein CL1_0675 [Thermococcus cleftensis]|uniref:Uncharacterized protein n=1 Tax=Thermococcus cleftensis (strain DSM 27260 / KACC 17922 / CL1) TaxID=163003 RepID=I3ZT46_THECF|nr:CGP-CTERM sorting domain-containing protein [Thermococcus cleftensis]AFL94880.1 hypothetical protein CL1_0675 [Thermococcus cleftensis]
MRRLLISLFLGFLLMSSTSVTTALSLWDVINKNETVIDVFIFGSGPKMPCNPFNDSGIYEIQVVYPFNDTHYKIVSYYSNGSIEQEYIPAYPRYNFTIATWDLDRVVGYYQNHIQSPSPCVDPENITRWVILMGGHSIIIRAYPTKYEGVYDEIVCLTPQNPSCRVSGSKPPQKPETSRTEDTTSNGKETCGPALLVGLTLAPLILRWKGHVDEK